MTSYSDNQQRIINVVRQALSNFTNRRATKVYIIKRLVEGKLFDYFPDNIDVLISKLPEIAKIDIRAVLYIARQLFEEVNNNG